MYLPGFNPRTSIRYDISTSPQIKVLSLFQSTHLYKVRHAPCRLSKHRNPCFNPRTSIRYDAGAETMLRTDIVFQSTHLYKVRHELYATSLAAVRGFNPRTSIRYDCITNNINIYSLLSMPLCDNKLFGFFIDEIELIDMFN